MTALCSQMFIVVGGAGLPEFVGEFLAGGEAAVDLHGLQQDDNGRFQLRLCPLSLTALSRIGATSTRSR
jgi:hypothetical protein